VGRGMAVYLHARASTFSRFHLHKLYKEGIERESSEDSLNKVADEAKAPDQYEAEHDE